MSHILVGVDGSEGSRHAAYFARDLARQTGARITLLVAIVPPTALPIPPFDGVSITSARPDPEHLAAARAIIDEIEAGDVVASSDVVLGSPAETILAEARRVGADLIVVSARGRSAAGRLLLGSVSERVIRDADRPVLVVR